VGLLARRPPTPGANVADLARLVRPQMLLASRHAHPGSSLPPDLLHLARAHGVTALLATDEWGQPVTEARRQTLARYVRTLHDLTTIRRAFDAIGLPWVIVKGAVLAHELYPRPDVRPFADADLLVPPGRLGDALDALAGAGAQCLVNNWDLMLRLGLAEITLEMPAGTQIDLHWSLANKAEVRDQLGFDTCRLLARSRPTSLLPGLRTLDDVDALVHVAWHCTRAGATRLLWLCDVELASERVLGRAVDVGTVAAETGTTLAVAMALDRAAIVFPDGAASTLARQLPDGWWRRLNRVGGRRITARRTGGRSGKALARATRGGQLRSLAALRIPSTSAGRQLDVSLGDVGGGAPARETYLRWVADEGR
jgi:hypothetical protein